MHRQLGVQPPATAFRFTPHHRTVRRTPHTERSTANGLNDALQRSVCSVEDRFPGPNHYLYCYL